MAQKVKKKKTVASLDGATMTEQGLSYNGVIMDQVVEKCDGCERVVSLDSGKYCPSYAKPATKWATGNCNFATHIKAEAAAKAKVNPLKASKRAAKGK